MDYLPGNNCEEWQFLGDSENAIPYQLVTIYNQMHWNKFELENFRAACGKFSGPIALYWNPEELNQFRGDTNLLTDIFIFDPTGRQIAQISGKEWSHSLIIAVGWTLSERLYVLLEDGRFFLFSLHGDRIAETKLFDQAFVDLVSTGISTESGCVCYTRTGRILYIQCDEEISITEFPSLHLKSGNTVTSMCCIEGRFTESGSMSVVIGCWNESVYVVNENEILDLNIKQSFCGRIVRMAVDPSGHYLACFTHEGFITVVSTTFDSKIFDFNVQNRLTPSSLVWCGEDSIVAYWKGYNLLMLSPFCDYIRFEYDVTEEPLFLVPEIDSLRIYSKSKHDILRAVPPALFNIMMTGSESPGSLLRKNFNQFTQKNSEMETKEGLGELSNDQIIEGIESCIEASQVELSTFLQESLLRSANYGQMFLSREQQAVIANEIPKAAKLLRILNALRQPTIGLYLTLDQYQLLTPEVVISRLTLRRQYQLGIKICQFLDIPHDFLLIEWACAKVRNSADLSDGELCTLIREKLCSYNVGYSQIAWAAYQEDRGELANLFLQYERKVADRVPVLLVINQFEKAASEAFYSHDQDLIQFVSLQLFSRYINAQMDKARFVSILNDYPTIYQCLLRYIHYEKEEEEGEFIKDVNKVEDYCHFIIQKIYSCSEIERRLQYYNEIHSMLAKAVTINKELDPLLKMVEDFGKEITLQKEIIGKLKDTECLNMTVEKLIRYCILKSQLKLGEKVKNAFKINDKKYWLIKINALADGEFWEVLKLFASEKKSPVGYVPFVEACLRHNKEEEAVEYLPRISDLKERYKYSMLAKEYSIALSTATSLKDVELLSEIVQKSDDGGIRTLAKKAINQLTGK